MYGIGKNDYSVELYKLKPEMTPSEIVKNEKCFYTLCNDSYYGLYELDRYTHHGCQEQNYLSTWNAQRRFWNGNDWEIRDDNPYLSSLTCYKDNAHPLFKKCCDS